VPPTIPGGADPENGPGAIAILGVTQERSIDDFGDPALA
jgi:hypothetical protein